MMSRRPQVLAIDDTPVNLFALGAVMEKDVDLQVATSGAAGIKLALQATPDLILLDVMMPDMDGYETCRRIKADAQLAHVPVIFLTALAHIEAESTGLALGAADYITKPINVDIARLRILNLLEREGLRREVMAQRDELQQLITRLTQSSAKLEAARQRELGIGFDIQRSLLKGDVPEAIEGACFACSSQPSQGIDGDFYDIRCIDADCFDVLVGDVMGKGVQAALIGAAIKMAYHQAVADLLIDHLRLPTPAEILNRVNQMLTPRLITLASFATLALYRFHPSRGTLTFVNAGHTSGLLLRQGRAQAQPISGDNLPIGVLLSEVYTERCLAVASGDSLLVFSDGITEVLNAEGEEFGQERLAAQFEAVLDADDGTGEAKLERIRCAVQQFTDGALAPDDQTALIVALR